MRVRPLLEINVATLAVLGTVLMGMGRESAVLPAVMIFAAAGSVWLAGATRRIRLGPAAVNRGILLAAAVCAVRIVRARGSWDLLLVGDTLVFVQVILLFEQRSRRTWWDVAMLSLFQVLIATQFPQGPMFGAVLTAYLFFGLATLALLLLDGEQVACAQAGGASGGDGTSRGNRSARPGRVDWRRLIKLGLTTVVVGPLSLFVRFREPGPRVSAEEAGTVPSAARPRPASVRKPAFVETLESAASRRAIGGEFWARVTGMASISLLSCVVLFCVVPRFGRIDLMFPRLGYLALKPKGITPRRAVGFSDQVTLGELGTIIDSPEEVLQIRFLDPETVKRYPVQGEVYLRGAVLTRYEDGQWGHHGSEAQRGFRGMRPDASPPDGLVLQEITIQPMDRQELFCVWPFVVLRRDERLQFNASSQRLRRGSSAARRKFTFELGTTAFLDGVQTELVPCDKAVDPGSLRQLPEEPLQKLEELAEQWIDESGIPDDDPLGRARHLERQLRESDRFEYTLEGQLRDETIDPIEDFIVNHPRGHCEYFATALTLMLRSQGIPARLVVGYKCDEYSYLSQAFRVRQSDAHTWVEAYVGSSELASEIPGQARMADWPHGGWLRLDPTPMSAGGVGGVGFVGREVDNWFQWLQSVWTRDVLGMTRTHQRDVIYGPLFDRLKETFSSVVDPNWWRGVLRSVGGGLAFGPAGRGSVWGLVWAAGVLGGIVAAALAVGYCAVRILLPRFRRALVARGRASPEGAGPRVEFYRRLETLFARIGLTRLAWQTQREFAREAGIRLAESAGRPDLVPLPLLVAEAFYQVRFGRSALSGDQAAAVEDALTRLEQATNGRR